MAIIECVPNISEGRRAGNRCRQSSAAVRRVPGARLLDFSSDASHNRSVITMAGDAAPLKAAVLALFDAAVGLIDLRTHTGEHPRMGAVDVVPFVPIEGATMDDCVALAKDTAQSVAERFAMPVYLCEEASINPLRKNLEDIRRGEFEGLAAKMATDGWVPDYGPPTPHPSCGRDRHRRADAAHRLTTSTCPPIASTSRRRSPRPSASAAAGSATSRRWASRSRDRGIVQVSMNLTNYEKTPILRVFEAVKREAEKYGVNVLESEIVGLVPAAALIDAAGDHAAAHGFQNATRRSKLGLRRTRKASRPSRSSCTLRG